MYQTNAELSSELPIQKRRRDLAYLNKRHREELVSATRGLNEAGS